MLKYLTAALAAVTLGLAGLLYVSHSRNTGLEGALATQTARAEGLAEATRQAQERLKSERKVLVARQAEIASQRLNFDRAQEALKTALQAEKDWNDTQVPTRVREALRDPSDGLHGPFDSAVSGGLRSAPDN